MERVHVKVIVGVICSVLAMCKAYTEKSLRAHLVLMLVEITSILRVVHNYPHFLKRTQGTLGTLFLHNHVYLSVVGGLLLRAYSVNACKNIGNYARPLK